jgi:predicted DNA-binding protein with PD1-like motif
MKVIVEDQGHAILRFDKDEEIFAGLSQYAKEKKVPSAFFTCIGSCGAVELGYYNPHLKDYRKKPFVEELEIISFTGNIGWSGAEPAIHAHGMFGRTDFSVFGGHVFSLKTLATAEIHLTILSGTANRSLNTDYNLNLLG